MRLGGREGFSPTVNCREIDSNAGAVEVKLNHLLFEQLLGSLLSVSTDSGQQELNAGKNVTPHNLCVT